MSDSDQAAGGWTAGGGNSEMPWTHTEMPCVYCGRALPRDSQRCPHCKTSYSVAVRRASREIEGDWFYLEPRNPSNRGVDFRTMLKLIEKGRLKRDSVVRGPATRQDWMFAAEAPRLSKYLGVCPHCFAPAGGEQEFCDTCHRHLDERPARLRPGVASPGAPCHFPDREALEEQLAESLKAHEMGRVASQAAIQESNAIEEVFGQESREATPSSAVAARPKSRRPRERQVKLHVVMLLTVFTVIPLGLLMLSLPVERVFGDPDQEGSTAGNVYNNRMGFWRWIKGESDPQVATDAGGEGVSQRPGDSPTAAPQDHAPTIRRRLDEARQAEAAGELDTALSIYQSLQSSYPAGQLPGDLQRTISDLETRAARKSETDRAVSKVKQIVATQEEGKNQRAKVLLTELSIHERALAADAGYDLAALELKIGAAIQAEEEKVSREKRRRDVRDLVNQAKNHMNAKRYDLALVGLKLIRDKYPADDLPEGVDLPAMIRKAENKGVDPEVAVKPPPPPPPPASPERQKADLLWAEVKDLEAKKKFDEAYVKCQEIQKMPAEVQPAGLEDKMKELKIKWFTGG